MPDPTPTLAEAIAEIRLLRQELEAWRQEETKTRATLLSAFQELKAKPEFPLRVVRGPLGPAVKR